MVYGRPLPTPRTSTRLPGSLAAEPDFRIGDHEPTDAIFNRPCRAAMAPAGQWSHHKAAPTGLTPRIATGDPQLRVPGPPPREPVRVA
jgi:hypothetical protein